MLFYVLHLLNLQLHSFHYINKRLYIFFALLVDNVVTIPGNSFLFKCLEMSFFAATATAANKQTNKKKLRNQ